jgi:aspartate ammonia-lyase
VTIRNERDPLGEVAVPADAYYGAHTARAVENFRITGRTLADFPGLVTALASVKLAACLANVDLGLLDATRGSAIAEACEEIRDGLWHDQFVVDPVQGGAGTSTNMNANEVIANRALEILGHPRASYTHLHPLDHVNLGQSTNDVYPTAVKLAVVAGLRTLRESIAALGETFDGRAVAFRDVIKMGRTQLQDAVPMTLGQEFRAYAVMMGEDCERLDEVAALLLESNLGGTAIGTGINGHPGYPAVVCDHLRRISGEPVVTAPDLIEATQDCGAFVLVSGLLKRVAVKVSKICNDLRLMSSGPSVGLGEINLPPMQAGSSIMPGKVNPVIPEVVNQVAFQVIGHDLTVTMAAEAGQLQLNAFEPVIAHSLLTSVQSLDEAARALASRCVAGITANSEHLAEQVWRSSGLVTALAPYLGYDQSASLAKEALASGRTVLELAVLRGHFTESQAQALLTVERLVGRRLLDDQS